MSEKEKVDINKHEVDIDTLKKQNVNDLLSIKELYRRLGEIQEKIDRIKYIDSTLIKKIKREYGELKKVIIDENVQVELLNKIEELKDINTALQKRVADLENKVTDLQIQPDYNLYIPDIESYGIYKDGSNSEATTNGLNELFTGNEIQSNPKNAAMPIVQLRAGKSATIKENTVGEDVTVELYTNPGEVPLITE